MKQRLTAATLASTLALFFSVTGHREGLFVHVGGNTSATFEVPLMCICEKNINNDDIQYYPLFWLQRTSNLTLLHPWGGGTPTQARRGGRFGACCLYSCVRFRVLRCHVCDDRTKWNGFGAKVLLSRCRVVYLHEQYPFTQFCTCCFLIPCGFC